MPYLIKGVDHSKKVCLSSKYVLRTEVNLEVVEVLMFRAGSYSEIWGCLFYSVNMLKMTRQIQEI